ncbi:MAG: hypothetical protein SFV52_15065 [Saprospiraceae bacterium]|nr:hypothetical protein [Saprospiraceae bacterium]
MGSSWYQRHQILLNAVLLGAGYLLAWWVAVLTETRSLFVFLTFLGPGALFPLCTTYIVPDQQPLQDDRISLHLFLSIGIYWGCFALMTAPSIIPYAESLAGAAGSLLYMLMTRKVLARPIPIFLTGLTAAASGGVFFWLIEIASLDFVMPGLMLCLWTLLNAALLAYTHSHMAARA